MEILCVCALMKMIENIFDEKHFFQTPSWLLPYRAKLAQLLISSSLQYSGDYRKCIKSLKAIE